MSVARIRKNDVVIATSGTDAGKTGKVLQVLPGRGRAIVEGLKIIKKHTRKNRDNPQGGIISKEGSIALSALMLYCQHCKKAVKVRSVREDGKGVRKCKKCGQAFSG